MKTTTAIKLAALSLAAGFPCAAFAEALGANLPAAINTENALGLFAGLVAVLTLIADYSRRSTILLEQAPAAGAATTAACTAECHRLAA